MTLEGAYIALDSLRANKVRAALTISGVAVGVFVVVAMGATVHGIRQSFQQDMDEFGTSTFQVRRSNPGFNNCNPTNENCPERRFPGITLAEWKAVQRLPEVDHAMAWLFGSSTVTYFDRVVKGVGYDAQSKLISAASSFYNSRIAAAELVGKTSQFNVSATLQAAEKNQAADMGMIENRLKALLAEIQSIASMATSLYNNLHANASASGSDSVSTSL